MRFMCSCVSSNNVAIRSIEQVSFPDLVKLCPNLTALDCSCVERSCRGLLTDEAITQIAVLCPQLSFLRVGDITDLTDSGIIAVAQKCTLQLLDVSGGSLTDEPLTDAAFMALTTAAPQSLTCLNMASNYELSSTTC